MLPPILFHPGERMLRTPSMASDPIYVLMPNQPQATMARRIAGEHRERNAVLGPRMGIEQHRYEDDQVAQGNRHESLQPVHPEGDHPARQHVCGNAVGHADPEGGVIVGAPGALLKRRRGQILVIEPMVLRNVSLQLIHLIVHKNLLP